MKEIIKKMKEKTRLENHINLWLEHEFITNNNNITIDNKNGSVRKALPKIFKEKHKRFLERVSDKEKKERQDLREKKYPSFSCREYENEKIIVVKNGYAIDFTNGKIWKSGLREGVHIRQSKLIGK